MPRIQVDQPECLFDQPLEITLEGFPPNELVEIVSSRRDHMNRVWRRAWARFRTDNQGAVDLTMASPLEGSYDGASPMGLFWSMALLHEPEDASSDITEAILIHLQANILDGKSSAKAELRRLFTGPGVTNRWLREDGLVGRLFLPPGEGPHPAMIVLTGSGGGINAYDAALLASHGYAALSLGYFAMAGLPPSLDAIPLEYFAEAMAWLRRQPEVREDFVGVRGTSRGGELALLLGAIFPEIRAVVGNVPSGVIHGGLTGTGPAWTLKGEPLAWLQQDNLCTDDDCIDWASPPVATTPHFESSLCDPQAVARAMIPVERINGPVLLISGTDDQMWPSTAMAELAVQRLDEHGHPHPVQHLVYDGAGHQIGPPFFPTTQRRSFHNILKVDFAFGGSSAADAHACIDSWPKILAFLDDAVANC